MSKKYKLIYALNDHPSRTFVKMLERNVTCQDFLQTISHDRHNNYQFLFFESSEIDQNDIIYDYWESDPNSIFVASTDDTPPSVDFIENITKSKNSNLQALAKSCSPTTIAQNKTSQNHAASPIKSPTPIITKDHAKVVKPSQCKPTPSARSPSPVKLEQLPKSNPSDDKDLKGNFYFCFTGGTKDNLLKGIPIDFDLRMNPSQCADTLLKLLRNKIDIESKQLLIYLPGGIPFIAGTLNDIYSNRNLFNKKTKMFIYGVLTRPISDETLDNTISELCNIKDKEHKILISPLVDSTNRGLSDMACLLGYLNHDGINGNLLLRSCASVIHFPPLLTSLNRIIEANEVKGRDIVTVCSTLYTFFRSFLPSQYPDNQILEYTLQICNLMSNLIQPPQRLPIMTIHLKPNVKSTKFLYNLKLGPTVYFWKNETEGSFSTCSLKFSDKDIDNNFNLYSTFTPISPLSMRVVIGTSIVKGKDREFLYLCKSLTNDANDQINVEIIDPLTGKLQSKDIDLFAKEQNNEFSDKLSNADQIKQIIMINFDESKFMKHDLTGRIISSRSNIDARYTMAYQYLTTFSNRIYGYHFPCIMGLLSFSDTCSVRIPLSPVTSTFSDNELIYGAQNFTPKLWDSILSSCQEIVKFKKEQYGRDIYRNAISRIVAITAGEDISSDTNVSELVKELIENKIILDSIIVSSKERSKMLCAVSHATGGFSIRPKDLNEGLSFIEKGAFLNYEERRIRLDPLISGDRSTSPSRLKIEQINEEFMKNAEMCAIFDTEIQNKELIQATSKSHIATPNYVCTANRDSIVPSFRQRRIMRELSYAEDIADPSSPSNDSDMKIFTFQSNLDRWMVFLKGPEGTLYANKWWYVYVTFPDLYPAVPPIFRFISVPFHLNVSSEGRVCLNIIYEDYRASKRVVNIIQEIKELFVIPNTESAVHVEAYGLYLNDRPTYDMIASASTEENAKNDYHEYISDFYICNDIPDGSSMSFIYEKGS